METSRRSFLKSASALSLSLLLGQCRKPDELEALTEKIDGYWSGIGFGIEMSAEWFGVSENLVPKLNAMVEQTIRQLESAFSLYSASSELSRLNSERELYKSSQTFLDLVKLSIDLSERTMGLCQPAIHGAWNIIGADPSDWNQQIQAASLDYLQVDERHLKLTNPLTELSFNALVQGFLADTVAQSARELGVTHGLLHLGESYAIGQHPDGRDWSLAVMGTPEDGEIDLVGTVDFADAGLAVSAHDVTRKLVNPITGAVLQHDRVVAVMSKEGASVADAFATAFAVADKSQWDSLYQSLIISEPGSVKIWQENRLVFEQG